METRLKPLGLTLNSFFVMMTLLENEGITQSLLGKRVRLPAYGMTRIIDLLQTQGLVERREDPSSRRNHLIFVTPKGREFAPLIFATVQDVNEWMLEGLDPEEREIFTAVLAKLV